MADVDPKDLLKKNLPLIVIYVLALVPIVLWFVMVDGGVKGAKKNSFNSQSRKLRSKRSKINAMVGKIKAPDQRVYTDRDVKRFQEQHDVYSGLIGELKATLASGDTELEKWFPEFKVEAGKYPKANDYITAYERKVLALGKTYAELVTPTDGGLPQVYSQPPSKAKDQLKLFQKRYWIQTALFDSLVKGSEAGKAHGNGAKIVQAVRFTEASKMDGPSGILERHDVSLVFTCSARDVPTILEKILAQKIPIQVRALRMQKEAFVYETQDTAIHVDGRSGYFADVYYTGELKDHEAYQGDDKQESYIPEPPIRVTLDLQVLDFDIKTPKPPAKPAEDDNLDNLDDQ
jgi:hypothetical protein